MGKADLDHVDRVIDSLGRLVRAGATVRCHGALAGDPETRTAVGFHIHGGSMLFALDDHGRPGVWRNPRTRLEPPRLGKRVPSGHFDLRDVDAAHLYDRTDGQLEHAPGALDRLGYYGPGPDATDVAPVRADQDRALDFCGKVVSLLCPEAMAVARGTRLGNDVVLALMSPVGRDCLELASARPKLMPALSRHLADASALLREGRSWDEVACAVLRLSGHVRSPASDRRICGLLPAFEASRCNILAFRDALDLLPPERIPRTPEQWHAFELLERATTMYPDDLRPGLLDSPGGDYVATWRRVMASRLARDVVGAAAEGTHVGFDHADTYVSNHLMTRADECVRQFAVLVLGPLFGGVGIEVSRTKLRALSATLVRRGRKVSGLLEGYERFHRIQVAVGLAVNVSAADERWAPVFTGAPMRFGDVEIACLTTPVELLAEGCRGPDHEGIDGLSHCVAIYAGSCLARRSHILSVRRAGADGRPHRRLSTVELTVTQGGEVRLAQHSGLENVPPPAEASRAVAELLERFSDGRLTIPEEAMPRKEAADVHDAAMALPRAADVLAAYAPLLRRDVRGLDLVGLARHVWSERLVARGPITGNDVPDTPAVARARRSLEGFVEALSASLRDVGPAAVHAA